MSVVEAGIVGKVLRVSRVTLGEHVYRDLRELILAGQVAPGDKFTLRGLAEAVGTSAMPVREAVGRLSAEGALEILPNRAIRVPIMTRERFGELTIIRMEVEGLAAQFAAERADAAQIAAACAHHERFAAESRHRDPDGAIALKANKELHFAVYAAAGMPQLQQIIDGLWLQVGPVINLDLRASGRRLKEVEAHKHHARLIAALKARQADEARAAVAADIRDAADFILANGNLPSASI
ncbi:MAG TPA: GntR family transcriptional regulator [Aurantimonas coralicida]|uniref:GntR family transcriptional regulator n=2 Tax=root TaxID=1 RepID=A0A9C9NDX3_9HYPH|nr:GntR family transcriptional regulator [Aurantimonas coralicida]HET99397.1 GntR family transcriptional regulator [Aurantimonas coralicida]